MEGRGEGGYRDGWRKVKGGNMEKEAMGRKRYRGKGRQDKRK